MALGAYEVPLIEMVSAFQVFQNGGQSNQPYIVDEIQTNSGQNLFSHRVASPLPVYDIVHTSMMVRMLENVIISGTGTRAGFGRPAAGKTGTSQSWRDAWFVGFTPDYAAGVWVGNDDNRPMNKVTGGMISAEIWRRFMMTAHAKLPVRNFDWLVEDPIVSADDPAGLDPDGEIKTHQDETRGAFYDTLSDDFSARQPSEPRPDDTSAADAVSGGHPN